MRYVTGEAGERMAQRTNGSHEPDDEQRVQVERLRYLCMACLVQLSDNLARARAHARGGSGDFACELAPLTLVS
jgi:hypothetical protein